MSDPTGSKREMTVSVAQFMVRFPRAKKTPKAAEHLFKELVKLLHEEKRSLHVRLESNAKNREIVLDSDQFNFSISVKKTPSMMVLVKNPEKTTRLANDVGNEVLSYLSTLLGEGTKGSTFGSAVITTRHRRGRGTDLSKKVLGDARIARLSELAGYRLNPIGIALEYESREREFGVFVFSFKNEPGLEMIASKGRHRGEVPFNFIYEEFQHLRDPATVIKKLSTAEL